MGRATASSYGKATKHALEASEFSKTTLPNGWMELGAKRDENRSGFMFWTGGPEDGSGVRFSFLPHALDRQG